MKDVDQQEFVLALGAFFKKSGKMKVPDFVDIVKTGTHRELAPVDPDWFFTRAGRYTHPDLPTFPPLADFFSFSYELFSGGKMYTQLGPKVYIHL